MKWKYGRTLNGYEGLYQVSNLGNVRNISRKVNDYRGEKTRTLPQKNLSKIDNGNGYYYVTLSKNKKRENKYIHRLVAETFLEKPTGKNYINHKDFNRGNNRVDNLEWCTQKENVNYSVEKMKHRKNITHSNTGEKYITCRKSNGKYRITIDGKEYSSYESLDKAIKKRNEILNGKEIS